MNRLFVFRKIQNTAEWILVLLMAAYVLAQLIRWYEPGYDFPLVVENIPACDHIFY